MAPVKDEKNIHRQRGAEIIDRDNSKNKGKGVNMRGTDEEETICCSLGFSKVRRKYCKGSLALFCGEPLRPAKETCLIWKY